MPRKNKKVEAKKQESGLQRIDTLFQRVIQKDGKSNNNDVACKKTNGDVERKKGTINCDPIVLSDDDDDFDVPRRQKTLRSDNTDSAGYSTASSSNSGRASSSFETGPQCSDNASKSEIEILGEDSLSDHEMDTDNPKPFDIRTPPTPVVGMPKKMKSDASKPTSAQLGSKFSVPTELPTTSSSFASPRQTQSCPATPTKPPPQRGAFTSPRKRWQTSPFSKFPVRKARSAMSQFKSLEHRDPYYLTNFNLILTSISREPFFQYLFNDNDHQLFSVFGGLTKNAQKLYVRLFQRQYRWRQASTIKYEAIAANLVPVLDELTTMKLAQNQTAMDDLREALDVMPAPELKELAKKYHVKADLQKNDLLENLIKHCKKPTIGSMFGSKSSDIGKKMLTDALNVLGPCYRLLAEPRALFHRCLCLFALTSTAYEDEEHQQQQLYVMLQVDRGAQKYPEYRQNRETKIYRDREALMDFQEALSVEGQIAACLEKNQLKHAMELHEKAEKMYQNYLERLTQVEYDISLPRFLQPFTAGSVYVRTLSKGVEVLQKQRKYNEANVLLERLLSQRLCSSVRGLWYDRLALNLDSHLKQQSKSLDVIGRALDDDDVRCGRRLALYQRAEKICNSKSHKALKPRLDDLSHPELRDIPSVKIVGHKMTTTAAKTSKSNFIRRTVSANPSSGNDDVIVCSVEEVALAHYREQGYDKGLHGEGSTLMTLLMLYFWDLVFDSSIPDVFYNRYQTAPLDMFTDDFYQNRKQQIDNRILWIENSDSDQLNEELEESWNTHKNVCCFGLLWSRFRTVDDAKSLVQCIGGKILSAIFRRHLTQMRHCRSGVPDLIVWNTKEFTFRVVEVKGPGDRLSTKQTLWLDYLLSIGVQAEVCHVEGVGAKRLKKVATAPSDV